MPELSDAFYLNVKSGWITLTNKTKIALKRGVQKRRCRVGHGGALVESMSFNQRS